MNREDTKKAIAVMQAYVDGAEIEWCPSEGLWKLNNNPSWDWACNSRTLYRIKPRKPIIWHKTDVIFNCAAIELTQEVIEALKAAGISCE